MKWNWLLIPLAPLVLTLASCSHFKGRAEKADPEMAGETGLPNKLLEDAWGIASVSVASGRERPANTAEMGTQILMGHPVRIWELSRHWARVESADGYLSWLEKGTFVPCRREEVEAWNKAPLLMVTALEVVILERNALSRRLPDESALRQQVLAVETERNEQRRGIAWQFTSRDARRKLERLYPVKEPSSD